MVKHPKWSPQEEAELKELREEIEQTTDAQDLRDLDEEVILLMERASYNAAERELRKEYSLPSLDQEVEKLKDDILELERKAAIRNSPDARVMRSY